MIYEIPLNPKAESFLIILNGKTYFFTTVWNNAGDNWELTIQNQNEIVIASSLPLLLGVDVLSQLGYLEIGGRLVIVSDEIGVKPTYENLGITTHLLFITP